MAMPVENVLNIVGHINPLDRPLWGTSAISAVIGKTPTQTQYLLKNGRLDATKVGRTWTSTARRLLGPPPPSQQFKQESAIA
jgi:hypothetical protein